MSIEIELRRLNMRINEQISEELRKASASMIAELRAATPVDTGHARDSWSARVTGDNKVVVENSVDYIEHLNEGSSKQAPAHFVERIALKYGKPVGVIVEVK